MFQNELPRRSAFIEFTFPRGNPRNPSVMQTLFCDLIIPFVTDFVKADKSTDYLRIGVPFSSNLTNLIRA